jgi:hypothetical protein
MATMKEELLDSLRSLQAEWDEDITLPVYKVVSLIESLEIPTPDPGLSFDDIDCIAEDIASRIGEDCIEYVREFDFSISRGNQIEVDGADFNTRELKSDIEGWINDYLKRVKEQ